MTVDDLFRDLLDASNLKLGIESKEIHGQALSFLSWP